MVPTIARKFQVVGLGLTYIFRCRVIVATIDVIASTSFSEDEFQQAIKVLAKKRIGNWRGELDNTHLPGSGYGMAPGTTRDW